MADGQARPTLTIEVNFIGGPSEWGPADHAGSLIDENGVILWGHYSSSQTGFSLTTARTVSTAASAWSRIGRFAAVAERMQKVCWEHCDAAELVKRMATAPDCVVYVDPPYLAETRRGRDRQRPADYLHDMGMPEDHARLAEVLRATPAYVLLSGYPSELYEDLYDGWHTLDIPVKVHSSNAVTAERGDRIERLWCNRPFPAADDLFGGALAHA